MVDVDRQHSNIVVDEDGNYQVHSFPTKLRKSLLTPNKIRKPPTELGSINWYYSKRLGQAQNTGDS